MVMNKSHTNFKLIISDEVKEHRQVRYNLLLILFGKFSFFLARTLGKMKKTQMGGLITKKF